MLLRRRLRPGEVAGGEADARVVLGGGGGGRQDRGGEDAAPAARSTRLARTGLTCFIGDPPVQVVPKPPREARPDATMSDNVARITCAATPARPFLRPVIGPTASDEGDRMVLSRRPTALASARWPRRSSVSPLRVGSGRAPPTTTARGRRRAGGPARRPRGGNGTLAGRGWAIEEPTWTDADVEFVQR